MQYLFLNGRSIRDRALQHALGEAYRGLLLTGRYPICFLQIEMPPEEVDVNVHPTKLEVRFQDGGRIYSQLLGTLRTKFLTDRSHGRAVSRHRAAQRSRGDARQPKRGSSPSSELVAWAKGQLRLATGRQGRGSAPWTTTMSRDFAWRRPLDRAAEPATAWFELQRSSKPSDTRRPALAHPWHEPGAMQRHRREPATIRATSPPATGSRPRPPSSSADSAANAIQVHNRYLIAETDDGMVVIDQHALHERILYEQIREKVLAGAGIAAAAGARAGRSGAGRSGAAVLGRRSCWPAGRAVEPFGGDTVLITSYPAMLANFRPAEVLREAGRSAARRRQGARPPRHAGRAVAHDLVQGGDQGRRPAEPEEIAALLEQRHSPGHPPLPARPPHVARLHPRRAGPAV